MKNRITLIGPLRSNAPHSAEQGVYNGITELGFECQVFDPREGPINDVEIVGQIIKFDPLFVLIPGCTPPYFFIPLLRQSTKIPVINWNSEEIRLREYCEGIKKFASLYDWIFHFDHTALPIYKQLGINNVSFLPQAFDPARHFHVDVPRSPHIQFIGSIGWGKYSNRMQLVSFLKNNKIPLKVLTSIDTKANCSLYSSAAASLNLGLNTGLFPIDSFKGFGLQQRVFECFGSNTPCFTNFPMGWTEEDSARLNIIDKGNVVFYKKENIIELAHWILDPVNYTYLSKRTEALKCHHTYARRLEIMIETLSLEGIIQYERPCCC